MEPKDPSLTPALQFYIRPSYYPIRFILIFQSFECFNRPFICTDSNKNKQKNLLVFWLFLIALHWWCNNPHPNWWIPEAQLLCIQNSDYKVLSHYYYIWHAEYVSTLWERPCYNNTLMKPLSYRDNETLNCVTNRRWAPTRTGRRKCWNIDEVSF